MLALINPVTTFTEGRCVANIKCIPAALAFCASLAINCSTFLPSTIIMSEYSSATTTIAGSVFSSGATAPSSPSNIGSNNGDPSRSASRTLLL